MIIERTHSFIMNEDLSTPFKTEEKNEMETGGCETSKPITEE